MASEQEVLRRAILRERIHLDRGQRNDLRAAVEAVGPKASVWTPARMLADRLAIFPEELLRWWLQQPTGHLVIGGKISRYVPGEQTVGRRALVNVAWIAPVDILRQRREALMAIASLLDHLLGCRGELGGTWLSEGGGYHPLWAEVGQRILKLHGLSYAPEPYSETPQAYFAWGVALYCTQRRELNLIDPLLERLLRETVMSPSFWRRVDQATS